MSHGCCSIPVKFKIFGADSFGRNKIPEHENQIGNLMCWKELKEDELGADVTLPNPIQLPGGWILALAKNGEEGETKDFGSVYATIVRKGDKAIYGLNTSQYENVGETEMEYFADDKGALLEFARDVLGKKNPKVEENTTVQQWG